MTLPLDPETLELAALYALDSLTEAERREADERFLPNSDAGLAFWNEVRACKDTANEMFDAAEERRTPPGLFDRVQARITSTQLEDPAQRESNVHAAQLWKSWTTDASGECTIVRDGQNEPAEGFEPTAIDGIQARCLFADRANDRVTMIVRMAPGTAYPAHRHGGVEECFVLEGTLSVGEEATLKAGDYQRMDGESVHPVQSTDTGCTLLLVSSFHDEILGAD